MPCHCLLEGMLGLSRSINWEVNLCKMPAHHSCENEYVLVLNEGLRFIFETVDVLYLHIVTLLGLTFTLDSLFKKYIASSFILMCLHFSHFSWQLKSQVAWGKTKASLRMFMPLPELQGWSRYCWGAPRPPPHTPGAALGSCSFPFLFLEVVRTRSRKATTICKKCTFCSSVDRASEFWNSLCKNSRHLKLDQNQYWKNDSPSY